MDAAILSWQDCLFSQRVEELLTDFLGNLELNGQKIDIKLQSYDLKQIEHHAVAAEVHRSKVQIIIISNHFIDRLRYEAQARKKMSPINRVLRPKRVIAVLVQLTTEDVEEYHQSVLSRFHEWYVVEMKAVSKPQLDQEFCGKVSEQITKIYNAELSSTLNFIIFPNKVTKDQPKIAILFKKPVEPGENVRFELSRGSQVQMLNDIQTTNPCSALIRVPDILCTDRSGLIEVTPYVNNHKMGTKLVKYEYQTKRIDEDLIERMSQTLPGFQKLLDDHISKNLSKNFRLCEDFSFDPSLELLNDTLISRGDDFPTVMHMACYYGLESTVWILLEEGDGLEQCAERNDMNETPLDIAQAKGYEAIGEMIKDYKEVNFTWKALQYVKDLYERNSEELRLQENGVDHENEIDYDSIYEGGDGDQEQADNEPDEAAVNSDEIQPSGQTPITRTRISSHHNIINQNQVNDTDQFSDSPSLHDESCDEVFANVGHIAFSSNLTIRGNRLTIHQDQIQHGEMLNGEYLMMGPAPPLQEKAPILPANYYDVVPTGDAKKFDPNPPKIESATTNNVLMRKLSKLTFDPGEYLVLQPSANPGSTASKGPSPNYPPMVANPAFGITKPNPTSDLPTQPPLLLDASDENLIELMNNFKDNVYSMQQLQLLFENWKSRNDVQEDMKERQKELKRIRDEYKKIQESAKKTKKGASLKFFPGKKKSSNAGLTQVNTIHDSHSNSKEVTGTTTGLPFPFVETHIPKPASESDSASPTLIWKNPHDDRFVTSYVQPTASNAQPEPSPAPNTTDLLAEAESPPPPRPAKKISTTMVHAPMCLSPTAVPYVKKAPPPPPPLSPTPKLSFVNYTRFGKKK